LETENISYKGKSESYSTPNRLVVYFENINPIVIKQAKEIRGPNVNAPKEALDGFMKSNKINQKSIYKKETEKGIFYFFKTSFNKIKTIDLLQKNLASILEKVSWKKSMKWGENELYWGRPLKSILSVFQGSLIKFNFHHLESSYFTYLDKEFEDKTKKFTNFKEYNTYLKKSGVILDHKLRKKTIKNQLNKITKKKGLVVEIDEKLLNEVTNLVECPNTIFCEFKCTFLSIPKEKY
jgi:Glycyl-tRNA synthetase, beta subunit